MLRPRQRAHGPPKRSPKPVAQNRRTLCRCSTTAAPASRAADSAFGPEQRQHVVGVRHGGAEVAHGRAPRSASPSPPRTRATAARRGRCRTSGAPAAGAPRPRAPWPASAARGSAPRRPPRGSGCAEEDAGDLAGRAGRRARQPARANLSEPMTAPAVSVVVPTRDRAGYLDVALGSLRAQEDAARARAARGGRRLERRDPGGGRPPRRARCGGAEAGRAQRRAQHRPGRDHGAARGLRGRRRAGAARLARGPGAGRRPPPRRRRLRRSDHRAAWRAPRRAPAGARSPRSPRSTSATRTPRPDGVGGELRRSGGRRCSGSAGSTRRSADTATRRTG